MIYGCGCLVMVGITLFLIWAAVVLSNPWSAALLLAWGIAGTIYNNRKRRYVPSSR